MSSEQAEPGTPAAGGGLRARADVVTDNPERYAKQLLAHVGRKRAFVVEDGVATAQWPGGTGSVVVGDGVLTLLAEAGDAHALSYIQDVLGRHLERFGRRGELTVRWEAAP